MSSLPLATIRERCSGFSAFLQKPFLFDQIIEKVTDLLPRG
jgi:hypothetical protein